MQRALVQATQNLKGNGQELSVGEIKRSKTFFTDGYSIYKEYPVRAGELPSDISQAGEMWNRLEAVTEEYIQGNHFSETGKEKTPEERKKRYFHELNEKRNRISSWKQKRSLYNLLRDYLNALEKACGQSSEPEKDS